MGNLFKIFKLSKKISSEFIQEEKISSHHLQETFNEKETSDILEALTSEKARMAREAQIKAVNKTKNKDWQQVKSTVQRTKSNKFDIVYKTAAAAVITMSLGLGYKYYKETSLGNTTKNKVVSSVNEKDIVLELENGTKQIISEDGTRNIVDKTGKIIGVKEGTSLNYSNTPKATPSDKLVFNQLTIPYGKIFQISLSDGTKVHLNSGSSLQYPINFIEGKKRIVYLQGEAYFDVAEDKTHPFIVKTKSVNVRVLGTEFNVSCYPEDKSVNTVLVEGAVDLYSKNAPYENARKTKLSPGHRAIWTTRDGSVKLNKVDTSIYTAWIDGRIVFEHMRFKNIIKKLERHYDVKISNNNAALAEEQFTASFDIETIDQVLNAFIKNYQFSYVRNGKQITIN